MPSYTNLAESLQNATNLLKSKNLMKASYTGVLEQGRVNMAAILCRGYYIYNPPFVDILAPPKQVGKLILADFL